MSSRWRKKLQCAWQNDRRRINMVTAAVWVAMLYLCRSCGPAAEWSQQDSCSVLLSLNHDMCYHSHHCSLHRSLQGNKHTVRQSPWKNTPSMLSWPTYFSPIKTAYMHTGVVVKKKNGEGTLLYSAFILSQETWSRTPFQVLRSTQRWRGNKNREQL